MQQMSRHVMIVDREPSRREVLRTALGLTAGEVRTLDDPALLPTQATLDGVDLVLFDLPDDDALVVLRRLRMRSGHPPAPVIALVPADRPDLRLAALRAGADEATARDTAPRILRARLRSLHRHREATQDSLPEVTNPVASGLA
jgi:DNA-binding response OmpR family regulator